jgi:hypothetical protein
MDLASPATAAANGASPELYRLAREKWGYLLD